MEIIIGDCSNKPVISYGTGGDCILSHNNTEYFINLSTYGDITVRVSKKSAAGAVLSCTATRVEVGLQITQRELLEVILPFIPADQLILMIHEIKESAAHEGASNLRKQLRSIIGY